MPDLFDSWMSKPEILERVGDISQLCDARQVTFNDGRSSGVKAIDVGGVGGTSFAAVEFFRTKGEKNRVQHLLGDAFWDWGIPTVTSIAEIVTRITSIQYCIRFVVIYSSPSFLKEETSAD